FGPVARRVSPEDAMSDRSKIGLILGLACLVASTPGTIFAQVVSQRSAPSSLQSAAPRGAAASSLLPPPPTGVTSAPLASQVIPPAAAIAPAIPQITPIAPLSSQTQTQFNTNSSRASNLALSSDSPSPSQSAPSSPGGGGKTLQDCINFWEPTTH